MGQFPHSGVTARLPDAQRQAVVDQLAQKRFLQHHLTLPRSATSILGMPFGVFLSIFMTLLLLNTRGKRCLAGRSA